MKLIITIDGPAGSGKSSLAKRLADKYELFQIDSGAIYRAFTKLALDYSKSETLRGKTLESIGFYNYLSRNSIKIDFKDRNQITQVNNLDVEEFLRTPQITANIKPVADNRKIRENVNKIIVEVAEKYPLVADGRDMGSIVFPDADIKFYITASSRARAERRFAEMQQKFPDLTVDYVEEQIIIRDQQDTDRDFGRLVQPGDAIFIDTTTLSLKDAFEVIEGNLLRNASDRVQNLINSKRV